MDRKVPDYVANRLRGCFIIFLYWKLLYPINTCVQADCNTWSLFMMKLLTTATFQAYRVFGTEIQILGEVSL